MNLLADFAGLFAGKCTLREVYMADASGAVADAKHESSGSIEDQSLQLLADMQTGLEAFSSTAPMCHEQRQVGDEKPESELPAADPSIPAEDPQHAETLTAQAGPLLGARYRILRPHAEGGLGKVFVASDVELNREVALKEIKPHSANDAHRRMRFLLEAEITGGLEHPGIVPVYGMGQYADGRPFYAMRFIRGESLKTAVDQFHSREAGRGMYECVEFRELLGRFIAVCHAVEYAHSRGVLHRDLKPDNIMLGKYGETLVVDWGLAKSQGRVQEYAEADERTLQPRSASDSASTQMGSAIGTPAFMSPEQARGQLDELAPASDVYSLGATLYYLLVGRIPFKRGHIGSVLQQVKAGDFPKPRSVKPCLPAALDAICLKAMAIRPGNRYATAEDLSKDLERFLADEAVSARPDTIVERLRRFARRHRGLLMASVLVLLLGLAGVSIALTIVGHANQRAHFAMQRIDELQEEIQVLEECLNSEDKELRESCLAKLKGMHRQIDAHFSSVPFFENQ